MQSSAKTEGPAYYNACHCYKQWCISCNYVAGDATTGIGPVVRVVIDFRRRSFQGALRP